jgi:phytoene desaturase
MTRKHAIVIGAGVGGLATANILAKTGYNVTVIEQNNGPGGRMDILHEQGFTFDTGPSWYLMKDVFDQYFNLFNKQTTDYYELARLDPAYKVFFDYRQPVVVKQSYAQNKKLFETLEPGAAKKLDKYLSRAELSYRLALEHFLYNPFTKLTSVARREVLRAVPAFSGLFATNLHRYISRRFSALPIQQILEYPSVFLGASPFNTPALYQLMSYLDFKEGVFYPKSGGMYSITSALMSLGKELGVTYQFGQSVDKIVVADRRATGVRAAGKTVNADIVISNADLHFTETQLLEPEHQTYPKSYWQKRNPGPSALLLYLGVRGALPELEHHNLFFTKQWRQNFDDIYKHQTWPKQASVYVSKTTATDQSTAPKGHENVFVLVPLPPNSQLSAAKQKAYVNHCLDQIGKQAGITDFRDRIVYQQVRSPQWFEQRFNSWQYSALGMAHTLRQSAFLRPNVRSKKIDNLFYVGAGTQPGIGVPMCLISAQLVYKSLTSNHSAGPLASLEDASA